MSATRAVVLLSGGLDSSTVLAIASSKGREVHALTVDYGQRHRKEIQAAKKVAKHFGVEEHKVLTIDLSPIGGSALTDRRMPVPEGRSAAEIGGGNPPPDRAAPETNPPGPPFWPGGAGGAGGDFIAPHPHGPPRGSGLPPPVLHGV